MEEQEKMSCVDCEHFKIKEKAVGFGLELWQMGTATCKKYHMEKAFHNNFELERLGCVGGTEDDITRI